MAKRVCAVTGGRGFAARHLVLKLLQQGTWMVRILDLGPTIVLGEDEQVLAKAVASGEAEYVSADLRDREQVLAALQGVHVVFHMAAPDSSINDFTLHHSVSVTGTKNVVDACLEHGVKKLIYTSSPSVVFDGFTSFRNADESAPYPLQHNDAYSETKAQGEQLVLSANGKKGLLTCAIRPSGIFGPGDRLFVPATVAAARRGKTKFIIGDGENVFDWTYVENVAHAHLCAERALGRPGAPVEGEDAAGGKAYFITNKEPIKFWEFIGRILEGLGYDRPKYKLPIKVVLPLSYAVEWASSKVGSSPGQFTPARMRTVSSYRTFNISRAEKLLGYAPVVSLDEAMKRTVESYSHLRKEVVVKPRSVGPSKVCAVLGTGQLADVLLWRDAKQTAAYLFLTAVVYYFLFIRAYSLVTLVAKTLLLSIVTTFLYTMIPANLVGNRLPKFPSTPIQVPEEALRSAAVCIGSGWNWSTHLLTRLVQERQPSLLLKVVLFLRVVHHLGRFSVRSLSAFVIVAAFSVPYVYEQYEEEIDNSVRVGVEELSNYLELVMSKLPGRLGGRPHKA